MRPTTITGAAAGPSSTFLIDNNGDLWHSGYHSHSATNPTTWERYDSISNVTSVDVGDGHAVAIDTDGNLWGISSRPFCYMGEHYLPDTWVPLTIRNITAVAAYGRHSLAVDTSGQMWATGANFGNHAGLTADPDTHVVANELHDWTRTGPADVTTIATGETVSAAITGDGNVWWCGGSIQAPWTPADIDAAAVDVTVTDRDDICVVTDDGNVTTYNTRRRHDGPNGSVSYVTRFGDATRIRHGKAFLFGHTHIITDDGRLIIDDGGWRERDTLGTERSPGWYDTGLENVDDVAEGTSHAVIVHTDGNISVVGATAAGALGHAGMNIPSPVLLPNDPDRWQLFCALRADGADAALAADVANRLI
jgi:alpha-tubulin suppressor-like RCC1 family protein